jgi:hypothetical protein
MGKKRRETPKKKRFRRLAPGFVGYVEAGPVTIRQADGSVETQESYDRREFQWVLRRSGNYGDHAS